MYLFIWLCWVFFVAQAFSSWGQQGLLLVVEHGLLIVMASLVTELRL